MPLLTVCFCLLLPLHAAAAHALTVAVLAAQPFPYLSTARASTPLVFGRTFGALPDCYSLNLKRKGTIKAYVIVHHVLSYLMISSHIMSSHVFSHYMMPHYFLPYHIMSYHLMICRIKPPYLQSSVIVISLVLAPRKKLPLIFQCLRNLFGFVNTISKTQ